MDKTLPSLVVARASDRSCTTEGDDKLIGRYFTLDSCRNTNRTTHSCRIVSLSGP